MVSSIFGISVALSSIFYLLIIMSWCFENVYQINTGIILVIRICHGLAVVKAYYYKQMQKKNQMNNPFIVLGNGCAGLSRNY